MTASPPRFAVYFAPHQASTLHQAGTAWLGRDAWTGRTVEQPALSGLPAERLSGLTGAPRRYGFHATLKPPFRLAPGASYRDLREAAAQLAATAAPLAALPLSVAELGGFVALRFAEPFPGLDALAAACVERLDRFRAPPDPAETARREVGLAARERGLLARWGYPWVMEAFRFHMTLSERLADAERAILWPAAERFFAEALRRPVSVDALSLFVQRRPDGPFLALERLPLRGVSPL